MAQRLRPFCTVGSPRSSMSPTMCRVEEPQLLQGADRALAAVRRHYTAAKPRLVQAYAGLTHHITPFDRILEWHRARLVNRAAQHAWGDEHHPASGIVLAHEAREHRLVPARPRS